MVSPFILQGTSLIFFFNMWSKSHVNPDHLSYFKFVGRVLGMSIWQEQALDVHFTKSVYKHILALPSDIHDLQSIDPGIFSRSTFPSQELWILNFWIEYHKNLTWLLENEICGMDLDLTFTVDENVGDDLFLLFFFFW